MTVLVSTSSEEKKLTQACGFIEEILSKITPPIISSNIFITTENEFKNYINPSYHNLNSLEKILNEGYGISIENIQYEKLNNGIKSKLVIINLTMCEKLEINHEELIGIILHELGHFFNKYPELPLPSVINENLEYDPIGYDKVQSKNKINKEIYADSFAKIHGYGDELLKSMEKYYKSEFCKNKPLFDERMRNLKISGGVY